MFFGPFKQKFEFKRVLTVFDTKAPQPEERNKNSQSTARKKSVTEKATIKSSNLSRGKTKQEMEADCKLKAQEEEVRRNQVIFSSEPVLCHHVGMQKELNLANENMKIMQEVLLKDPNIEFAEAQHQMFKEKLENLRVGERSNHSTLTQELFWWTPIERF